MSFFCGTPRSLSVPDAPASNCHALAYAAPVTSNAPLVSFARRCSSDRTANTSGSTTIASPPAPSLMRATTDLGASSSMSASMRRTSSNAASNGALAPAVPEGAIAMISTTVPKAALL
jgi:hypothetical protein